jgi:hypothetical protein
MFSNLDYHDAGGTLFYRFESASGNASPHGHLQRMRWPKTVLNFVSLHGFLVNYFVPALVALYWIASKTSYR